MVDLVPLKQRNGLIATLPILGLYFTVKWKTIPGQLGEMSLQDFAIRIHPNCPQDWLKRVLIHEINHAITHLGGVAYAIKDDYDESCCTAVENLAPLIQWGPEVKFASPELRRLFS